MQSSSLGMTPLIVFLTAMLFLRGTFGKLECENLSPDTCAFAISSSGKRCSLETYFSDDRSIKFECKTSEIMASVALREHIESSDCINSCGVDKTTVGISTDKFLEPRFSKKLCSQNCQMNCPNIVDLYSRLALAEGVYLPAVCKALAASSRRKMKQMQIQSSEAVARRQKTMQNLNRGSSAAEADAVRNLNHGAIKSSVSFANAASTSTSTTLSTQSDAAENMNLGETEISVVASADAVSSTLATKSDAAENLNLGEIESGVDSANAASINLYQFCADHSNCTKSEISNWTIILGQRKYIIPKICSSQFLVNNLFESKLAENETDPFPSFLSSPSRSSSLKFYFQYEFTSGRVHVNGHTANSGAAGSGCVDTFGHTTSTGDGVGLNCVDPDGAATSSVGSSGHVDTYDHIN
ncbi:OLC1v1006138C1 [Oldenlandia corymbosa var. corymbosa]|uniref:OLC1v1006138C1 n=1 Tax=Oldenlandia corymbosa var. corymbosa TaxID=529605 RepID=A0AAV1DGX7_OLDCO|nr:OLC1v1006138C1 [Oldenlandia corymbosa var. corymbosa]